MGNIKLKNNATGEIIEKTELNWKHLPNDRKALYTVVNDEGLTAQPAKNFTPPELQPKTEEDKKEVSTDEAKQEIQQSNGPVNLKKDAPAIAGADETQEQQVIRLFTIAAPKTEEDKKEAIKSIAKDVAAHFKTVEKIVNAYLKK